MTAVGVLALQGDVPEHAAALQRLLPPGALTAVRRPAELERVGGLVLPGGESTTLARLLRETGLFDPLARRIAEGLPVFATCAGLILVAQSLSAGSGTPDPETLGGLGITVRRNGYGGQAESFEAPVRIPEIGPESFPGVFVRAPRILAVNAPVRPIAFLGEEVVGVARGSLWGFTFHPELGADPRLQAAWVAGFAPELLRGKSPAAAPTPPKGRRRPVPRTAARR